MRPGVHILGFRAVSFTPNRELVQHLFGYPGSLITISNVKMSKTNLDHPAYRIALQYEGCNTSAFHFFRCPSTG
jgi:hypothetical protein